MKYDKVKMLIGYVNATGMRTQAIVVEGIELKT